jgi:hypothetical protein
LAVQAELGAFLLRGPDQSGALHRNLVLALDGCAGGVAALTAHLLAAVAALPPAQPFHLAVIAPRCVTYVVALDDLVVSFDVPHGAAHPALLNLRWDGNYPHALPLLAPYLAALGAGAGAGAARSADDLAAQLAGDATLFSRILLFSPRAPARRAPRNVCLDWVLPAPAPAPARPAVDGYFLLAPADPAAAAAQIRRLVELVVSDGAVFNVDVTASVTAYKFTARGAAAADVRRLQYAAATRHFRECFRLVPLKLGGAGPSLFAVEARFLRFHPQGVFEETVWLCRQFRKSADFIPVCASLNPFVLAPILCDDDALEAFVVALMNDYHQHCLAAIAGGVSDLTFAALPNLQWLLHVLWGPPPRHQTPIYGDVVSRFTRYRPWLSYWTGPHHCIAERVVIGSRPFKLLGQPAVAVLDSFDEIAVYGLPEADPRSPLGVFIAGCVGKRFPKPIVAFKPQREFFAILEANDGMFKRVMEGLAARVDRAGLTVVD